ncbi:MAG: glycosyltransferase family 2 protein [Chloroflexi bacterium]|nr:glycosyltransferase family 2 protein [Chloroflexota bacterium]
MTEPELSIVIAADAPPALGECLASIERQRGGRAVEVLVVSHRPDDQRIAREHVRDCVVLDAPPSGLAPHRWAVGIGRAQGRLIALTDGACVPDANWIDEIVRAHAAYHSGIGGALELADGASLLDRATYFVRWARHMPPLAESSADLPGENVSYKRAALAEDAGWIAANGFWPQDVNEHLRGQMRSLRSNPACVVRVKQPYTLGGIARHQVISGRLLGQARARRSAGPKRWLILLATPVIPLVRLQRIARAVAGKRRHGREFATALPLIFAILVCEAAGELDGMLRA